MHLRLAAYLNTVSSACSVLLYFGRALQSTLDPLEDWATDPTFEGRWFALQDLHTKSNQHGQTANEINILMSVSCGQ
jgi:hypothetical protein